MGDLHIMYYGIKDITKAIKILEKIKKIKNLTFNNFSIKISKINIYLYTDDNSNSIKI